VSLKIKNKTTPGLITLPGLIISVILGLSAFLLILSDIQINLPGTNLSTDPREIFVLIGAALTGPIGAMISGALSSIYDPNPDIILYVVLQHMFAALWVSIGYKFLIFKNYSIPRFIIGWILIVLAYYYVFYIPIYVISYFFFPNVYSIINNGPAPLWSSLFEHYKGWTYEIIFTTVFSLIIMFALPFRYCIPKWGNNDLIEIRKKKAAELENFFNKVSILNRIGVRAFTFFMLLSVIPLIGIGIFIKKDVTKNLLEIEALYMKGNANKLSGILYEKQLDQYPGILSMFSSPEDHFFIMDLNGNCKFHVKNKILTTDFCSLVKLDIISKILKNRDGFIIDNPNYKTYGFSQIKGSNLIAVFHSNEKNILSKIPELQSNSINKLLISFIIIYLISGFVIWLVIARPIKVFKKAADQLSVGNYTVAINEEEFDDEINSLASSFNKMTKNIIKSHQALIERDFLLKIVVANTPVVHFIIDTNRIFRLSIGKGLHSLGLYENQVVGLSVDEVYKDFPDIIELINNAFKGETSQTILFVNNHYFDTKVIPSFNDKKELESIIGIATEITDIVRYEQQIIESEQKYRLLAENSTDIISIFSADGIIVYMSPQCYNFSGYQPEEMYGKPITEFVHPDDIVVLKANHAKMLNQNNEVFNIVFRFIKKDGTLIWVETNSRRVQREGKEPEIQASTRDISERKKSEEEIRKLLLAVEQSPVMILITGIDGKIEYVNPTFTKITGFTFEEAFGKTPALLKSGFTPETTYIELWKTITAGGNWNGEIMNMKKDGTLYWESVLIAPIKDEFNKIKYYLGVKEDITERKNMEQELRAALDRAEESDTLKTNLLANMSHELRTPMNGILGLASILREGNCSERQADMLSKIILSGKRLMNTLNSVLDLTQIESGIIIPAKKEVSLADCVNNALAPFYKRAAESKLTFDVILPDEKIICMLDERIFNQIMAYLIDNALKFTFTGGVKVIIGEETTENISYCFVKITDTGIGIAPKHLKMIFEEFKQVSEGYNRSFEGLGLGLTNAKKLANLLDGNIFVESKPGVGSTFTLQFNSIKQLGTSAEGIVLQAPKTEHKNIAVDEKRVLIVEDNDLNIEVIKSFLKGYISDTATNGQDAIKLAAQNSYSIILMDINLKHDMTGIDAMKEIRKITGYDKTPILAITGFAMIGDREKLIAEGFNDYLQKPFNSGELNDIVKKYI